MKRIFILLLLLALASGCTSAPQAGAEGRTWRQKPPALTVISGDNQTEATLGTYSWSWPNADGTRTGVEADGLHPLDMLAYMTPLPLDGARSIELRFEPGAATLDRLTLRRWDLSCAGDPTKYESDFKTLPFALDGDTVTADLSDGRGGIFEVHAYFTGESRGDGWYGFCLWGEADPQASIPFESQPVRVVWREGLGELPEVQVIRSREELLDALEGEEGYESAADLLYERIASCSGSFFDDRALILLRIESGSGSIRFEAEAVERTDEGVTVTVRRTAPEVCTADMAAWLLFIEVPADIGDTVTVTIL